MTSEQAPPPPSAPVVFVDVETTGLHPDRHEIWEVALILPPGDERPADSPATRIRLADDGGWEVTWQLPIEEAKADPFALNLSGYWDRRAAVRMSPGPFARMFRDLVGTRHIVGAVPSFDEERLRRLLEAQGVLHRWHYHPIDVEALAAGYLHGYGLASAEVVGGSHVPPAIPWRSEDLSRAVGVDPSDFDRHTALGDARWAKAIYQAVLG